MLGVRRASVSLSASALQKAGVIDYERGQVEILDQEPLHEISCECYDIMRAAADASTS